MDYLKEIGMFSTPICNLFECKTNKLFVMRDDLLPFSFGGNKSRKALYFFNDILSGGYNYVITYGSASSNHCRIIANLCNRYNIGCTIISTEIENETNNKFMCKLFNAEFVYCNVNNVKVTIDEQLRLKRNMCYQPYFIQGGGHGNLGTQAYIDAYKNIIDFEKNNDVKFDYIFHASGTGTTQAGLILGKLLNGSDAKIIGISIARKLPYGRDVVIDSINDYIDANKLDMQLDTNDVIFEDKYVLNGYGSYNIGILQTIKEGLIKYGMPLDKTYTGKAFWGMQQFINENKIIDKNILFIHTGGTPLFFDDLKEL